MGRRHRRKTVRPGEHGPTSNARDHQARVKVTDDVWQDFRLAAGGRSVARVLGELVTEEVERYRLERVRAGHADDRELLAALDSARELHDRLSVIVRALERRLDRRAGPGV